MVGGTVLEASSRLGFPNSRSLGVAVKSSQGRDNALTRSPGSRCCQEQPPGGAGSLTEASKEYLFPYHGCALGLECWLGLGPKFTKQDV